jgi:hypothetical protein
MGFLSTKWEMIHFLRVLEGGISTRRETLREALSS